MNGERKVTRHDFLRRGAAAIGGLVVYAYFSAVNAENRNQPANSAEKQLPVDVSFKDEDSQMVIAILNEIGGEKVEAVKQRGLTGIEIVVVGVIVASALANLVIRLLPLWKCGVVVDARRERVLTEKTCDLPRGSVLIVSRNGTETKLHQPSEVQVNSAIAEAIKLVPKK